MVIAEIDGTIDLSKCNNIIVRLTIVSLQKLIGTDITMEEVMHKFESDKHSVARPCNYFLCVLRFAIRVTINFFKILDVLFAHKNFTNVHVNEPLILQEKNYF